MATILFDGVAYGMLLFVLACGLAVTLGLMNFVNLAHGAFAMAGGYVCAVLVNRSGWPFFASLPLAFVASALIGAVLERALYRHLYNRSHLDQVLFWVGVVFMSVAAVDYIMGSSRIFIKLPAALEGQFDLFGVGIGRYRLMIIVICGLLTAGLQLVLARTRFGSRLRAAVDDPRAASGLGINVPQVFAFTFAFGCGLAGLGGALSAEILGLDPYFPLKFMIYFLIVVTVGGSSSITGPFLASLLLGIGDVAGKYYVPKLGPFVIYTIMIVILIWRPNGLFGRVPEPVIALVVAGLVAMAVGFLTSFLVIRGADLTRLMVTLGIALLLEALAERFSNITGGTDGLQGIEMQPILGLFAFDMFGKAGFFYCLAVLFVLFLLARRIAHSPFGLSLRAIRNNPLRAAAIGIPVNRRLIAIYTLAAFYAGVAGALFTQTTALASLDVFSFERSADLMLVLVIGGTGYLYGGLIGAVVFRMLQEVFSTITPQYWQFWIGLVLVVIVLVGRVRMHRWALWAPNLIIRQLGGRKAVVVVPESDAP